MVNDLVSRVSAESGNVIQHHQYQKTADIFTWWFNSPLVPNLLQLVSEQAGAGRVSCFTLANRTEDISSQEITKNVLQQHLVQEAALRSPVAPL